MDPRDEEQARKAESLLSAAERLKKRAQGSSKKRSVPEPGILSDIGEQIRTLLEGFRFTRRFFLNTRETLLGVYERVLRPIWSVIGGPLRWVAAKYAMLWNAFCFRTDATSGEKIVSRGRSAFFICCTLMALAAFTPTRAGDAVRFFTVEPMMDAIMIGLSQRTETFYLSDSEEIDPDENVFSVRGCKTGGQCAETDAAYFRVKPRLFHDLWKLVMHGNPIYLPDHVVAPIAPGLNRCEVTYYGYRMSSSWISRLLRSLEIYPVMLEATCTHLAREPA